MVCAISQTANVSLSGRSESENVLGGTFSVAFGMRSYSPELGRWVNRDPIGELGGLNVLAFVSNSPVIFADLLGFSWQEGLIGQLKGFAIGIFVDFGISMADFLEAESDARENRAITRFRVDCPSGCKEKKFRIVDDSYFRERRFRFGPPILGISFSLYEFDAMSREIYYECCCKVKFFGRGGWKTKTIDEKEEGTTIFPDGVIDIDGIDAFLLRYHAYDHHDQYRTDYSYCKGTCPVEKYWTEFSDDNGGSYVRVGDGWIVE